MPPRRVKVAYQGKMLDADELEFEAVNESWNEYACIDGAKVRVRMITSKIARVIGEKNEAGEPIYVLQGQTIVAVTPPPGE